MDEILRLFPKQIRDNMEKQIAKRWGSFRKFAFDYINRLN